MAKLYPPQLGGAIPAFYNERSESSSHFILTIPFSLGRTVSPADIKGFAIKIKTLQSNTLLWTDKIMKPCPPNCQIEFNIPQTYLQLAVGQSYLIQLAFIDRTNTIGHFSSAAIVKYTSKPVVSIVGLNTINSNNHTYSYTGMYSQAGGDATEKLVSSRFIMKDREGNVIADSGDISHKSYNDESFCEAYESYNISYELANNTTYTLQYITTSANGLVVASPEYVIKKAQLKAPIATFAIDVDSNFDEGYNVLTIRTSSISNTLKVVRAASNDNYVWRDIYTLTTSDFMKAGANNYLGYWKDYNIEQGVRYQYALQETFIDDSRSDYKKSQEVLVDFEDIFLYDGKRQLKIRYNPKVSSFKRTILEQKSDTIGGQYPVISRNGMTDYHEFPISGLLYLESDNTEFRPKDNSVPHICTMAEQFTQQREYKLEVLRWLTNGEPKLFKSATEGNYIVHLMNVTLTPNDTTGRLLHSFSATAYEIDDTSYDAMLKHGFVTIQK